MPGTLGFPANPCSTADSRFNGIGGDETAFAAWLAQTPTEEHTYVVRDLRDGRFVSGQEFVLEDDAFGREWMVIRQGTLTDYFFLRRDKAATSATMAGKTHLVLKPVHRGGEMDRLLAYPQKGA